MFRINNFYDNTNIEIKEEKGPFKVLEYQKNLSVDKNFAMSEYFSSKMQIRKRQLSCDLSISPVTSQTGAMQWMIGEVELTSGIKGVGDFFSKSIKGSVTKESAVKPEYKGKGTVVLEPTYKHIILIDLKEWNNSIVLEDGYFLACTSNLKQKIKTRTNLSSSLMGNEGIFNLKLEGEGILALESPIAKDDLIEIELENDEIKIDGSYAIAWSDSLDFSVKKASSSLLSSAMTEEGFVNVYKGSGKILLAPLDYKNK